ncbi:hypothetical protein [Oceanobacillus bengalensis]|uniref:Carboxypeptidase regulatory-like domain-containing protein n=1 Tax=Oceanobacillus bengalensis TaxID=1435466 RepID=A0A494YR61_9BACI|nr:hypothetical protein [Oceanobacillus bengalensis]RKQ11505.1 hypothetical protein D8M05_19690 [Oceanobacillus bengalensis]
MKKKYYVFVSFVLCFILLAACGDGDQETNGESEEVSAEVTSESDEKEDGAAEEKAKEDGLGDFNIQFTGEVVEDGDKFIIEGKSNLIPGSRLVAQILVSEEEVFADTTELVGEDGSFHMELDHHQYGEAQIVVRFDFDSAQDDPVIRHYGDRGQNLEGPFIYKHEVFGEILKKAEVNVSYDPNEQSDLMLKAPEWNELPEDYGDPRVWIEVDEITEDGEFFYLEGRSNLLEGAKITGSFGNNRDEGQIKPDGSFDLQIEYEYIEDKDFVIEFDPLWQWNEIEEAYGSEGQKMVGDLIQTAQFSDKQYVEKIIPWEFE